MCSRKAAFAFTTIKEVHLDGETFIHRWHGNREFEYGKVLYFFISHRHERHVYEEQLQLSWQYGVEVLEYDFQGQEIKKR